MTKERVQMGPDALHGSIERMLELGLVVESDESPGPEMGDARRRCYRLPSFGVCVLAAEACRLSGLVQVAQDKQALPRHDEG